MICRDCGRVDGLKILIREQKVLCKQCHAKESGCEHKRLKVYKDYSDPEGGSYSVCKDCGEQREI